MSKAVNKELETARQLLDQFAFDSVESKILAETIRMLIRCIQSNTNDIDIVMMRPSG